MKTVLLVIVSILSTSIAIRAGWIVESNVIRYSADQGEGHASFDTALRILAVSNRIQAVERIVVNDLLREDAFQKELLATLDQDVPLELQQALASAGNGPNPRVVELARHFQKAVLATPTVTDINSSLAVHGLRVSDASFEKFWIEKRKGGSRFHCILSLSLNKPPNN